jgi:hypothetical protein
MRSPGPGMTVFLSALPPFFVAVFAAIFGPILWLFLRTVRYRTYPTLLDG